MFFINCAHITPCICEPSAGGTVLRHVKSSGAGRPESRRREEYQLRPREADQCKGGNPCPQWPFGPGAEKY